MISRRDDLRVIGCPRRSVAGWGEGRDGRRNNEKKIKVRVEEEVVKNESGKTRSGEVEWRRKSRAAEVGGGSSGRERLSFNADK